MYSSTSSNNSKLYINSSHFNGTGRILDPQDITIQPGYKIEVFATGFDAPGGIVFTDDGDMIVGETGYLTGRASVIRIGEGITEIIADDIEAPLSGICYHNGDIYITHKGSVSVLKSNGTIQKVLTGLPSNGDHVNSIVAFGPDDKMYFGLGTATNSGVVGMDNAWIRDYPFFCDFTGSYVMLNGQNYRTINGFAVKEEEILTGAFSPYGISNLPYEVRKGVQRATGSILRANPDGTELEQVAWGFRYPCYVRFDRLGRLFASNQGCDVRGSRPIANAPDEFLMVIPGQWYGWPDYVGGEPVTLPKYRPEGRVQPEFLFSSHPGIPSRPFAVFPNQSYIFGFDFNYNNDFGYVGDAFIAEFGGGGRIDNRETPPYSGAGHRISTINMENGIVTTFAINKSGFPSFITGEGGFGRPVEVVFGPDGALYVVDIGLNLPNHPNEYIANTGVIWKITRE